MRCPKCGFDHPLQTTECLKCGIVFSKYKPPQTGTSAAKTPQQTELFTAGFPISPGQVPTRPSTDVAVATRADASAVAASPDAAAVVSTMVASLDAALSGDADSSPAAVRKAAVAEFKYRLLALPLALLVARWLTGTGFNMVAGMLAMVVHECGHAVTAWLAGRWAVPTLWFTMIGQSRSWLVVVLVAGAIVFGGFQAWRARRWGWVCAAAAGLLLQLDILSARAPGALIIFGGDGGAMVLATILMATFYAPRDSVVYKSWGLRWGLLAIGALAFMHVYRVWSGPWGNIPFGQIEGRGPSDPTLLTEMYGWSVIQLVDRYIELARACFGAMGLMYGWGLLSAYAATRLAASQSAQKRLEVEASR
jgi:hypothetical protein